MRRWLRSVLVLLLAPALSDAVSLDAQGRGQALIFPHYTVRSVSGDAFNTIITIVNSGPSQNFKALRVRFREGRNGREAAAFNLFLPAGYIWAAAVVPTADGARLVSAGNSCTSPNFTVVPGSLPFLDFSNAAFSGANADGLGSLLDRTREGYVEVIEMAVLPSAPFGVPCPDLSPTTAALATGPTGGLSGTLTLINVASGLDFTVNADALADLASRPFYRPITDPYPDFDAAEIDPVSVMTSPGITNFMTWRNGVDAVQSVLMRYTIENEVTLDTVTSSATDWIVTFPTKRFNTPDTPRAPFSLGGPPFIVDYKALDGASGKIESSCTFTCAGGEYPGFDLRMPWASTVLSFKPQASPGDRGSPATSGVVGSQDAWLVPIPTGPFSGLASVFPIGGTLIPVTTRSFRHSDGALVESPFPFTMRGLPMVGFSVRTFSNGLLRCAAGTCLGNYGGAFSHKWVTLVR